MAVDLVIDVENTPGALAQVATAISDAGVNIAAATFVGPGDRAEIHILVPHAEAVKHALAISHVAVTGERQVVVVDVEDRPGVLADLTRLRGDAKSHRLRGGGSRCSPRRPRHLELVRYPDWAPSTPPIGRGSTPRRSASAVPRSLVIGTSISSASSQVANTEGPASNSSARRPVCTMGSGT